MKRVLITGGGGGIAQAIKRELENEGFDVLAPNRREMDVTNLDSMERTLSTYRPDILINNAGYVVPCTIKSCDLQNTKRHIDINLCGTFFCTEIGLKYNPNLDIINIGSAAAIEPHATWSEYCATKAAVVMATKCWSEDGLYAVVLSPGRTRTKMRKNLYPDEDQKTLLAPEDFAKVVAKAAHKELPSGIHLVIRKENVEQVLKGEMQNELL